MQRNLIRGVVLRVANERGCRLLPARRWCSSKESFSNENTSADLKTDREVTRDTSFMVPVRFFMYMAAAGIGACVFVFSYRFYYTYSVVSPMRKRMLTDPEMEGLATRDYDDAQSSRSRQRVKDEGLMLVWVPWPLSMWGYRKIPPPTPESRPQGGSGGGV
eukprot:TRINITY_DN28974_c0_g1_i1.p1 TRINITY_DN28974_c0_g1~~TRINITY_DN28974_c0_g1_i1.p1  ORF type:complete len:188 (+),score=31.84 TRINITY_DN28974_c0_g1_i1:82-564(+)